MLSNKSFSLALGATALATMLLVSGFALYLVPMSQMTAVGFGDLSRIGWYSNNRYGGQKPNLAFRPSLVTQANTFDRHYDVVVLGDSFSLDLKKSWPNYLAAKGLSVLVIGLADDLAVHRSFAPDIERQIKTLLDSPAFRDTPPDVFIFETIERYLKRRLVNDTTPCVAVSGSETGKAAEPFGTTVAEPPVLAYGDVPAYRIEELTMPPAGHLDEQQLTYARDFLIKNARKALGWKTAVGEFRLRVPRFSSERSKTLLVLSDDLKKKRWQPGDVDEMQCQLRKLQQSVQANGKTLFVALPIPDKLSAYHDDLVDQSPPSGVIDSLTDPSLNRPRLEKAIRAEITAGEIDVYLPNDTHFGSRGQQVTAETVLQFIEERARKASAPPRIQPVPSK